MIKIFKRSTPNPKVEGVSDIATSEPAIKDDTPDAPSIEETAPSSVVTPAALASSEPEALTCEVKDSEESEIVIQKEVATDSSGDLETPVKIDFHDYKKDAQIFAEAIAKSKMEKHKANLISKAIEKICNKSIKTLNKTADDLTANQVIELFGNACDPASQDFDKKIYADNYWPNFQKLLKQVKLDFSVTSQVQNEALGLVNKGTFDFDDYYATVFSDSMIVFKKSYDSNDFTTKSYQVWLSEINQQYYQ
jgi:hypothetical protein